MELKVNLKTILLFSTFFILTGMILGFYSCSANTTPTSPDVVTDDAVLVPPPIETDEPFAPGTPLPGLLGQSDVATYFVGYDFEIDASGKVSLASMKEGSMSTGPLLGPGHEKWIGFDPGFLIEFGDFTRVGNTWEGNVTLKSLCSSCACLNPRLIFDRFRSEGIGSWDLFSVIEHLGLVNLDGFSNLPRFGAGFPDSGTGIYPFVFIADEDENYYLDRGEEVTHEIVLESFWTSLEGDETELFMFTVFFVCEVVILSTPDDEVDFGAVITGVPHDVLVELEEDPVLNSSIITVRIDVDYFNQAEIGTVIVDVTNTVHVLPYQGVDGGRHVLQCTIPTKPSVDGPVKLFISLPPVLVPGDIGDDVDLGSSYWENFRYLATFG